MTIEEIKELIEDVIAATSEFERTLYLKLGCSFACFQSELCAKEDLIEAIEEYRGQK